MDPFSFLEIFIMNQLEKWNVGWGSASEGFVEDQEHLAQVEISDLVQLVLLRVVCLDDECLALPVEGVDLVLFVIIETFVWEVSLGWFQLKAHNFSYKFFQFEVEEEMVMCQWMVVKQVNEKHIVIDEAAVYKWVWEVLNCHGPIIDS